MVNGTGKLEMEPELKTKKREMWDPVELRRDHFSGLKQIS
jgi:hypothetical protein